VYLYASPEAHAEKLKESKILSKGFFCWSLFSVSNYYALITFMEEP
jgi:hypothetical protein